MTCAAWVYGKTGSAITNCLFAGNIMTGSYTDNGMRDVSELVNCTIAGNTMAKMLPPFALKPKSPARGAGQTLPGQSEQLDLAGHSRVAEGKNVGLGASVEGLVLVRRGASIGPSRG